MSIETEIKTGLFTSKYVFMDYESLVFDDTQMMTAEMTGFSYGATVTSVNGIKANTEYYYRFVDSANDAIEFKFVSALLGSSEPDEINDQLLKCTWDYVGNRLLTEMVHQVSGGGKKQIGTCMLDKTGIHFTRNPLFGKASDHTVPWHDIDYEVYQGILILKSKTVEKAKTEMPLRDTLNAHILLRIAEMIARDPSFAEVLSPR